MNKFDRTENNALISKDSEGYHKNKAKKVADSTVIAMLNSVIEEQKKQRILLGEILNIVHNLKL